MTPLEPVSESGRIEMLDVVRGVALLGILLVNLETFAFPPAAFGDIAVREEAIGRSSSADRLTFRLIDVCCKLKFVTIFSIWFGISLQMLAHRAVARGAQPELLLGRRMVTLAVIGFLHGAFLWYGDILLPYAMVGVVALVTWGMRPAGLLLLAAAALAATVAMALLVGVLSGGGDPGWHDAQVREAAQEIAIYSAGTPGEILESNRSTWMMFLFFQIILFLPRLLADLWIGMAAVKLGLLQDAELRRRLLRWLAWVALPVGLALEVARAAFLAPVPGVQPGRLQALELGVQLVTSLVLALGYIGALGLWAESGRTAWLRRGFARIGRTALSCYLGQTVLCTWIFYSYGLGLFASLPALMLPGVAAGVIALEMALAGLWLRGFRMGPAEWVWRLATYGRWVPLLRARAPEGV